MKLSAKVLSSVRTAALRKEVANSRNTTNSNSTWSGSLSYASPEADFCAVPNSSLNGRTYTSHSCALSFASPEADLCASPPALTKEEEVEKINYKPALSFATPDADFTGIDSSYQESLTAEWSGNLSYASPECDFTGADCNTTVQRASEWSYSLSFASPEGDFSAANMQGLVEDEEELEDLPQPEWSHNLSFTSPEADFVSMTPASRLEGEGASLPVFSNTMSFATPEADVSGFGFNRREHMKLPRTLAAALMESHQALVITTATAPHRIVHVNSAWEELCGFKREDILHQTLNVIQGPESNAELLSNATQKVVKENVAEDVYVVNYKKDGSKFIDHFSIGPLALEAGNQTAEYIVGIMQPVEEKQVPLRLANI